MVSQTYNTSQTKPGGLRVLVVDDLPDNVESLALLLRYFGYEVITALNGYTAISLAIDFKPDVALLDLSMPMMDGFELARRLRRLFHYDITIIALTARGLEQDRRLCLEAGFDRHLTKPADPEMLDTILGQLAHHH